MIRMRLKACISSVRTQDIISVTAGTDAETACIKVEFVERVVRHIANLPLFHPALYVDEDNDSLTGDASSSTSPCNLTWEQGFDALFTFDANIAPGDLMEKISLPASTGSPTLTATAQPAQAFAGVQGGVITFIVPLSSIGGDGEFAFVVSLAGQSGQDCSPEAASGTELE